MKSIYIIFIIVFLQVSSPCFARDFMVDFIEEHYRETQVLYAHQPKIYHTLQVRSHAGPKLLVLSGEATEYRTWLRQYIARGKQFMVQVPDEQNDAFVGAKVFDIDVTRVHPFDGKKWGPDAVMAAPKPITDTSSGPSPKGVRSLFGDHNVMVIDKDLTRSSLISSIITQMGYNAIVSRDGRQALEVFRVQPEKFKMIITHHEIKGMSADDLITKLLKIDYNIPIIVETGYNNHTVFEHYLAAFSGAGTVTVKPVVLDNLQRTINALLRPEKAEI